MVVPKILWQGEPVPKCSAQDFPELKPYLVVQDPNLQGMPTPQPPNSLSPLTPPKSHVVGNSGWVTQGGKG